MSKYNNILNLFSLALVLIILFIIMYGCQFRVYTKKKIEKFTDSNDIDINDPVNNNDDNDEKDEKEKYENMNDNDNDNKDKNKDENKDGNKDENKDGNKDKDLSENEANLLDQFINEKFSEEEINKLILKGEFTKDNLENIISYIDKFTNRKN